MSYYWNNRDEVLKKFWDRYHNKGRKEKAASYYKKYADLLRFETNMKYKNMSRKEKNRKRKYQRERYYDPKHNEYLEEYQRIYDRIKKIKKL